MTSVKACARHLFNDNVMFNDTPFFFSLLFTEFASQEAFGFSEYEIYTLYNLTSYNTSLTTQSN